MDAVSEIPRSKCTDRHHSQTNHQPKHSGARLARKIPSNKMINPFLKRPNTAPQHEEVVDKHKRPSRKQHALCRLLIRPARLTRVCRVHHSAPSYCRQNETMAPPMTISAPPINTGGVGKVWKKAKLMTCQTMKRV